MAHSARLRETGPTVPNLPPGAPPRRLFRLLLGAARMFPAVPSGSPLLAASKGLWCATYGVERGPGRRRPPGLLPHRSPSEYLCPALRARHRRRWWPCARLRQLLHALLHLSVPRLLLPHCARRPSHCSRVREENSLVATASVVSTNARTQSVDFHPAFRVVLPR